MSAISDEPFFQDWRSSEKKGLTHLVLVTANRLRLGKTYAAMRLGEALDPDFDIEHVGFDTQWYVEQADKSKRGCVLVLDEPNRAAGNRNWYSEENRGFAEYLQTNAYRGIHGLFPLPHQHLMDNAVTGVCTSQVVMMSPGHGQVYLFERDQLNRSYNTYTPRWGDLFLKPPSAILAHAYEKKRDEYTRQRNKQFLKQLEVAIELEKAPTSKEYVEAIITNKWSTAVEIQEGLGVNRTRAYDLMRRAKHEAMRRKIEYVSS